MNSMQRVLKTIAHKEPDRVPVGEFGIDHDHVSKVIGRQTFWTNRKESTLAMWQGRRNEVVESMIVDYEELINSLDYDIITVGLVPPRDYIHPDPPKKIAEGIWQDSQDRIYKYAASNDSISCMSSPSAKNLVTDEDIDAAIENIPSFDRGEFEIVEYFCKKYGKEKIILFRDVVIDTHLKELFGGDETHWLMVPVLYPEQVINCGRYANAFNRRIIEKCCQYGVHIIMCDRDYGCTRGCIESPQTIRQIYMPFHKDFTEQVEVCGKIPFLHCCGNVWTIMDDLIAAGYKGYQSIQGSAGMDLAAVKACYGDTLTLWTGVQCETLVEKTAIETEDEVKRSLEICMPGGGFIFGSTNSVQYGAKTDNYLRALDTVRKYGNYN